MSRSIFDLTDDREGPMLPLSIQRHERRELVDALLDDLDEDDFPLPMPGNPEVSYLDPAPRPPEGVLSSFAALTESLVKPAADKDLARQIGREVRARGPETGRRWLAEGPRLWSLQARFADDSLFSFYRTAGQERYRKTMDRGKNGRQVPHRGGG